jgi:hypothetical protein
MAELDAAPADAGSATDPVSLISGLLERENPPPKPPRNVRIEPSASAPDPDEVEPGPEEPPVEEGDDEEGEETPEEEEQEPELFAVKIDGKEEKVPLDELVRGYQRQSDYSRNMNQLAEHRRAADAAHQEIMSERNHYVSQLDQVATVLQAALPTPPSEQMLQTDPLTYVQQEKLYEAKVNQLRAVLGEKQRAEEQSQREMERQHQQMMSHARQHLLAELPDWKNPEKARAGQRELADYMRTCGYSEQEIAAASDPRAVVGFRKAMLYDRLQAAQPKVTQKLATAPKMVRPGAAGPAPDQAKALTQRVKRSGGRDMDAIARLIELG